MRYVLYKQSGEIVGEFSTDREEIIELQNFNAQGIFYTEIVDNVNVDGSKQFYNSQRNLIQNKKDYELNKLPIPCKIEIESQEYFITEQPDFVFDTPGLYYIRVTPDSKQYLEKEFEYVVEA